MAKSNWIWRESAEILGVLGVIGSMIFIGIEIRQNTYAVRGATYQAVSQQSLDLVMAGLDNPELRSAFDASALGGDEMTPEQRDLMGWFISAKLRTDENRFRQVELGILDEAVFLQLSTHGAYRQRYFAEYWARSGHVYADDFQDFVRREYLPLAKPAIADGQ